MVYLTPLFGALIGMIGGCGGGRGRRGVVLGSGVVVGPLVLGVAAIAFHVCVLLQVLSGLAC